MNGKSFICCTKCKAKTAYFDSEEEAITVWNNRTENLSDINYCPHCGKKIAGD